MVLRRRGTATLLSLCIVLLSPRADAGPGTMRVTLLGTAGGPPVRPGHAGVSTLVEAGGQRFLFDAGRNAIERIVQAGLPMDAVTKVFVTHLHSDHVVDLPALLLLPWSAPSERKAPLEVWGPRGTRSMMRHLTRAFAYDIHVRRDLDEKVSPEGIRVIAHDIREGVVYENGGVKITAFLVDHGPVKPSFGYRVDYAGRSVAISGDTRPSENLVRFAKGVDVLIHEAIDADALRRIAPSERLAKAILAHHTTGAEAGEVFRRTVPRLAVFSHSPGTAAIVNDARAVFPGRIEMGEDLMVIEIGDEIAVRRPGP